MKMCSLGLHSTRLAKVQSSFTPTYLHCKSDNFFISNPNDFPFLPLESRLRSGCFHVQVSLTSDSKCLEIALQVGATMSRHRSRLMCKSPKRQPRRE
ncbi:hypothetical protein Sjap_007874 [Stephania japonica]|uniref:Uncharacterized protein n=1 Tax=Stephania japonica TaxID=461633 RepID=A0AAP0JQN8_9MAGN